MLRRRAAVYVHTIFASAPTRSALPTHFSPSAGLFNAAALHARILRVKRGRFCARRDEDGDRYALWPDEFI